MVFSSGQARGLAEFLARGFEGLNRKYHVLKGCATVSNLMYSSKACQMLWAERAEMVNEMISKRDAIIEINSSAGAPRR